MKKVTIIGGGLSGLSAACYLAKNNYDVTLIDKNNNNLGRITSGCYSPMLSKSIALGYIDINYDLNENFYCNIRNNFAVSSSSSVA